MNAEQNRCRKASSGGRSMLGASVFVATVVTLAIRPILLRAQGGASEGGRTKATISGPHRVVAAAQPAWKTCKNGELGFEFEYPADWKIIYSSSAQGGADEAPIIFRSCEVSKSPGGDLGLILTPGETSSSALYIHVCDRDCMKHSIFSRAETLKQYLAMEPYDVLTDRVARTTRIGGVTAVVLEDGSILAMHDGRMYDLYVREPTPKRTRLHLLKTFRFTGPTR